MGKRVENVVVSFVNAINQADIPRLTTLLSSSLGSIDLGGQTFHGGKSIAKAWQDYITDNPNFRIYIRLMYALEDQVILIGNTTGSHLDLSEEIEFHAEGVLWLARVHEEKISSWRILADTLDNYNRLGLEHYQLVFDPELYAASIAKHLDLLPTGTRTQDVRNVRKYYSREYKLAQPEDIVQLGERLLFDEGYRFFAYELIYYHPGALDLLSPERAIRLGQGINEWSSADIYAHYIAGPAWKKGILTDDHLNQWIASNDIWWRRAAVVSTIYLGCDVERMLRYTEKLIDDPEDLIIKALSWVLRSATACDQEAVIQFLTQNEARLAARIKREVRNKLKTGLKNP